LFKMQSPRTKIASMAAAVKCRLSKCLRTRAPATPRRQLVQVAALLGRIMQPLRFGEPAGVVTTTTIVEPE